MLGYSRKRAISEMTQSESVKVKSEDVQPTKKLKIKIETDKEGGQNKYPTSAFKPIPNYKTVPCKNFALDGNCQFGGRCTFKHGSADDGQSLPPVANVPQNYKIVPCKSWSQVGQCTHGDRCTFMHGNSDYKGGLFVKPYKKIPCKFFADTGFCERGVRCGFLHGRGLERGFMRGFSPISAQRPRSGPLLMSEAISPTARVIRNNAGYFLAEQEQIRLSGLSESHFVTPSRFLDVRGITPKERAASIFPGIMRGGRNQQKPIPPNYKTVACTNFAKDGTCRFGSSCTYKHGDETVDPPILLERPKLQPRIPVTLKSNAEYKSVPCMAFIQTGFCQYGEECWFIHGDEGQQLPISLRQASPIQMPLRRARPMPLRQASFPEPGVLGGYPLQQNISFGAGGQKPNYKTVMCKHWEKDGKCPFNEKCTYKHGDEDSGRPI